MRTFATLVLGCCALLTQAQSVSLSPLFGSNGAVRTPVLPGYNDANAHAITANGKLLLAGDGSDNGANNSHVSLVRLDTTCGALDTTFGVGGKIGHIHEQRTFCTDIAMQPDGKIVGCGTIADGNGSSQHKAGVFRFNADGSVDSTFNGTGYNKALWDPISSGNFFRPFVNADSSITCAGQCYNNINGGVNNMGAMRFTHDGVLDTTFSSDGIVTVPIAVRNGTAAMRPDGRLLVIGPTIPDNLMAMAQFNTDGSLDTTFGSSGTIITPVISYVFWTTGDYGLTILPDGRILYSGPISDGQGGFLMARFLEDGTLDTTYGTNGISSVSLPDPSEGLDHVLLPDGGSLQFGFLNSLYGTCLKRDADGQVVTAFGTNGFAHANYGNGNDKFYGGGILPSGRIIGYGGSWGDMLAVMYTPDAVADALPVISVSGTDLVTTGNGSFQWSLDGVEISGATGNTYAPTANGDYTVTMTVSPECTYTSAPYTLLTVGLSEVTEGSLRLAGNPVTDVLVVQNDGAPLAYELLTITGQRLASGLLRSGRNELGTSDRAEGVYILRTVRGALRFVKE